MPEKMSLLGLLASGWEHVRDFVHAVVYAVIGSTTAMFWLRGSWPRRIGMWGAGIAVAATVGEWLATLLDVPAAVIGLVVGLFGMSVIDRLFDAIQRFDLAAVANRVLDRFLGR